MVGPPGFRQAEVGPCDGSTYRVAFAYKKLDAFDTKMLGSGETLTFCSKDGVIGANENAKIDPANCDIEAGHAVYFRGKVR